MSQSENDLYSDSPYFEDVIEAKQPRSEAKSEPYQSEEWDRAEERLLLYLRALNVPAVQRMEIALEALARASKRVRTTGEHPVTSAMQVLQELLPERKLGSLTNASLQMQKRCEQLRRPGPSLQLVPAAADDAASVPERPVVPVSLPVVPPLNRATMVAGHMDRKPWLSFLSRCFGRRSRK